MASKEFLANHSLTSKASSALVTSITKTLQSINSLFFININSKAPLNISSLSQFSSDLNPNLVIQVINNQFSPYHALVFFRWASKPYPNPTNYSHTFRCYIAMLDLLLSHRLFTTATQFLESHNKLCDFTIARLIKAFGAEGDIRAAIDWFHRAKMVEKDGNCLSSCNALLSVLVRATRMKLACSIFNQVVEEGLIRPDVYTYTTMIRGYVKVGKLGDAQKVFDEMRCRPNHVTYGTILKGFCDKGMMVEARQLVDKMIMSKDNDCLPDLIIYSTLINGYCKKRDMEAAMLCFDEMLMQGLEPNLITYNAIVHGFCLVGKIDEAKKMMTKMRLNGIKDDVVSHMSLLMGFSVVGRIDDAVNHLKDMISIGIKPDVKAYGLLVNEFCKLGKGKEAIALMREAVARNVHLSISSFNAVLKVLVERGELKEAVILLKWMSEIGCVPTFLSYSTVISSLSKTGRSIEQVEELIDSMLRDGHKIDASIYSCLTMMYSTNGEMETASRIVRTALVDRCVINIDSFAVFMKGLCAKGKIFEAEKLTQELLKICAVTQLKNYQTVFDVLKHKYSDEKS